MKKTSRLQKTKRHPIFIYLKRLVKKGLDGYRVSLDNRAHIIIFDYTKPSALDNDARKFVPWIHVEVKTRGGRITELSQIFRFYYPKKEKEWNVETDGNICFKSFLGTKSSWTFWERDKSSYLADSDHPWIRSQLDVLQEIIGAATRFNPYKETPDLRSS